MNSRNEILNPVIAGLAVGVALVVLLSFYTGNNVFPLKQGQVKEVIITLKRTVCYGTCPDYELTIYGNGTVVYEGYRYVAVTGRHSSSIPHERVKQLVDFIHDSGFFSMKDAYRGFGGDNPTATTSIKVDGAYKKVFNYYPDAAPQRLKDIEDQIDIIADSDKWVKCPLGDRVATGGAGGCMNLPE